MRTILRFCSIVVIVAVSSGLLSAQEPSESMKEVRLTLVHPRQPPISFHIPRVYISRLSNPNKDTQQSIRLAIYLPDYLPYYLAERAGHKTKGKSTGGLPMRSEEEIGIEISSSVPDAIEKNIEWVKLSRLFGGARDSKFEIYFDKDTSGSLVLPMHASGYLIPIGRNDLSIHFSASPVTQKIIGCQMYFLLEGKIAIKVFFAGTHLNDFEIIRQRISEIVRGFVVD